MNSEKTSESILKTIQSFKGTVSNIIFDLILNPNILNVYVFGSQVYGTANAESDTDIIVVAKEHFDSKDINVHVYTVETFQMLIDRHDIQALECIFSNERYKLKLEQPFVLPVIDKSTLRKAISTIASNSWVKGKKKLTVAGDYDLKLAIKSIFHSLRILEYGYQIASSGKIYDFETMNWLLADMYKLSETYQREALWQKIDDKYRSLYNTKSTLFKKYAPKDLEADKQADADSKRKQVEDLLKEYGVESDYLTVSILNIFEK
jgi:predicted nucleotidyltransferase